MGYQTSQPKAGAPQASTAWDLAHRQHGVIARRQLLELGFHPQAVKHRLANGRLHPVLRGVYAVGRPEVSRYGRWMAAVLSCGPDAVLSHHPAAALWGIAEERAGPLSISVPAEIGRRSRPGIVIHRRTGLGDFVAHRHRIPVTSAVWTLLDLARTVSERRLDRAVNEADKLGLVDVEELRSLIELRAGASGVAALRALLDRRTFALTDSELERRFLRLALNAGVPRPETGRRVNGFKVDFYWPGLGLVVETDGLRYHRTPAQQARDRLRDQSHTASGLTTLRFTHEQVRSEGDRVAATLLAVVGRLQEAGG